ncbi:MAG: FKBP-type peptidyl-prolyl cis-trans isomerase [Hymenobacteraceae bacterium]|nr:FKBP-type peptidyl-prolyl cis-trans isomerase [Hymenobacteraceae bacterium]
MRASLAFVALLGLTIPAFAQAPTLDTPEKKTSYAIGQQIGSGLKSTGMPVDLTILTQALTEAFAGAPARLTPEEMQQLMMTFQQAAQTKQQESKQQLANTCAAEGKKFLEENAKKSGVKTLPSGLQYKTETLGNGPSPTPSDVVKVHYRGTLLNGKEFDSSYSRGEPAQFGVGQVIKGWTEALQKMRVGAKWKLFIPAELAYGDKGAGADIAPNSTLIFDVELLEIVGKPKAE